MYTAFTFTDKAMQVLFSGSLEDCNKLQTSKPFQIIKGKHKAYNLPIGSTPIVLSKPKQKNCETCL